MFSAENVIVCGAYIIEMVHCIVVDQMIFIESIRIGRIVVLDIFTLHNDNNKVRSSMYVYVE